jgi:hypothetical protein
MSERHLDRKELIEASKKYKGKLTGHLANCSECRESLEFLLKFPVVGRLTLRDAPAGWVNKASALAESKTVLKNVSQVLAQLIFDSWAMPEPVGVRGPGALEHRRLRFETSEIILDMRAERTQKEWNIVAQIAGNYTTPVAIMSDRDEHYADDEGIFQWVGQKPPRKMKIRLLDKIIEIPELVWKRPRKK